MKILVALLLSSLSLLGAASTDTSHFKNIVASNIVSVTLDTAHGANELYPMDQDLLITSSPTFQTLQVSNLVVQTLVNSVVVSNLVASTLLVTNLEFQDTLVADLGTPASGSFPMKYCSDVITAKGVGGYVRWDAGESKWITFEDVEATTDPIQFVFNAKSSRLYKATRKSVVLCSPAIAAFNQTGIPRSSASTGIASGMQVAVAKSWGVIESIITGSFTNSVFIARGPCEIWLTGDIFACGGSYSIDTASVPTNTFDVVVGMGGTALTVAHPTTGIFFLYDPQNTREHNLPATNNWICVTGLSSSYTFVDSGLPATIGSLAKDDLGIIYNGVASFYTNNVLCASITNTLPLSGGILEMNNAHIAKRNGLTGTNAVTAYESLPWCQFRYFAPRTY